MAELLMMRTESQQESGGFGAQNGRESVQELARSGVSTVPAAFVQPPSDDTSPADASPLLQVPLIDMQDFHGPLRASAIAKLASACQEWGFFQVINHNVPQTTMMEMRQAVRGFFGLPLETKQKWAMKEGEIFGYGRFNTGNKLGAIDWVDLLAHLVAPLDIIIDEAIPTSPPNYRDIALSYTKELQAFVHSICCLISESLGLELDYIEKTSGAFSAALRLNYYPPCPEPHKVLGLGSHSDGGTLTVLMQDGSPMGLQVRHQGKWVTAHITHPYALLVNVADMLEVISNGRYASVDHRAIVNKEEERYSIVLFYFPELSREVFVRPAPPLISKNNPPKYKETTYVDYLNFYLIQRQPGKARIDSLKIEQNEIL